MTSKIALLALVGFVLATSRVDASDKQAPPELVTKVCSTCHGARGISTSPMFPNLAGQQPTYLENQLKGFRDRSRADPHAQAFMWGMAAQLSDSTITQIAEYFSALPPAHGKQAGSEETAAGEKIFKNGIPAEQVPACYSCHGPKAEGNGIFPRLAGQHRSYLERQLAAFMSNTRANAIMHENAKNLTALQISQVAAYLSSLP
jgi:cytochrome c553